MNNLNEAKENNWENIPGFNELENYIGFTMGIYAKEELLGLKLKGEHKFNLSKADYILHKEKKLGNIVAFYEKNGFETKRIVQDPIGHPGPTVACPIGFPFNLPFVIVEMKRFNRWICRVHVDIGEMEGKFVSIPHIEPDPKFHPFGHIWDTYINKRVVRGKEAVQALNFLGIM